MKKLHYAWIEQVLSFDSNEERTEYIEKQKAVAERKKQAPVQVMETFIFDETENNRFGLRIRKPYNTNPMLTE